MSQINVSELLFNKWKEYSIKECPYPKRKCNNCPHVFSLHAKPDTCPNLKVKI